MTNKTIECKDCKRAKEEMSKNRIKHRRNYLMPIHEVPKQILVKTEPRNQRRTDVDRERGTERVIQ